MDAIELLTHQHREIENFFREIRLLDRSEPQSRRAIFELLRDAIEAHDQYEEQVFYPAAHARRTAKHLVAAQAEHRIVRERLQAMRELDVGEPRFDQALLALEEAVRAHHRAAELELMPQVRTQLGSIRLFELGQEMEALTERQDAEPEQGARDPHPPPL